jgi:hypothetical protein
MMLQRQIKQAEAVEKAREIARQLLAQGMTAERLQAALEAFAVAMSRERIR